ncbi:MAG: class I tRNA ligase family protein, partial [Burkholderiaceae bacterium]
LQRVEDEVERQLTAYRFDLAAKAIYEFLWNEFCDWYLELAKISLQSPAENAQKAARRTLLRTLEATLRLVHPFMPFITEALWQAVAPVAGRSQALVQGEFASISTAAFPKAELKKIEPQSDAQMSQLKALVGAIRSLRAEMGLGPGDKVPLRIQVDKGAEKADSVDPLNFEVDSHERTLALAGLAALCRLNEVSVVSASDMLATHGAQSQQATTALAPVQILGRLRLRLEVEIDLEAEKARLQKEIDRLNQEIAKCKTKLSNPQFVDRAPAAVVQQEQTRLTEFEVALSKVDGQHQAILRA